jgi:hypothetical protein
MRLLSWITAINVLVASGFAVVGVVAPQAFLPGSITTDASRLFAMYAATRIIPLAVVVLAVLYKRSSSGLFILGILAGIIQFADAGVGFYLNDLGKTVGPLVIALIQSYAVFRFHKLSSPK